MKDIYFVKSDRYNHTHKFVKTKLTRLCGEDLITDNDLYLFTPEEEWMPIYLTYSNSDKNEVKFIDTEGGPIIFKGWNNGNIVVDDIFIHNEKLYFKLLEL